MAPSEVTFNQMTEQPASVPDITPIPPAKLPYPDVLPPQTSPEKRPKPAPVTDGATPTQRIGREFGLWLLGILAVALAGFLLAFSGTEYLRMGQLGSAMSQVFQMAGLNNDGVVSARIRLAADDIATATAGTTPEPKKVDPSLRNTTLATVRELASQSDLSDRQKQGLAACVTLLSDGQGTSGRETCLTTLDLIAVQHTAMAPSTDRLRAAADLLKQVREAQQEQRGFWQQMAQLVLLNLLLPLLTAVFGYVFGTQQGQREANDKATGDTRSN